MTQVDEWTPLVLANLTAKLGATTPTLIALMKETGAILSGGFVLQAIAKYSLRAIEQDLDIYVPCTNMPRFLLSIIDDFIFKGVDAVRHFDATIYCRSFLRKNGIRRVHTFGGPNISVDVMSVRTRKTPVEVCSNFDLTFCQVWFDGTTVFATHPDHIREMKGHLQGDYVQTFIAGNEFLKKRLLKYKGRGFAIEYEPSVTAVSLPTIEDLLAKDNCTKEDARKEVILPVWFQRAATRWLSADPSRRRTFALPFGRNTGIIHNNQLLPAGGREARHGYRGLPIADYEIPDDEGYDSETMDTPKLTELAMENYTPEEGVIELAPEPLDPALVLGRSMFALLRQVLAETQKDKYGRALAFTFNEFFKEKYAEIDRAAAQMRDIADRWGVEGARYVQQKQRFEKVEEDLASLQQFSEYLSAHSTRTGQDFVGDDGQLYDIHSHPLEGGITRDTMEGYLNQFRDMPDIYADVPCFHKPEPVPESPTNCTRKITFAEIQAIVSPDFLKKYTAPRPVKTGLNVVMPIYEAALPNMKSLEPGYGDEYHETMCPFCLQPMTRGEGCSYMTHANPKRLPGTEKPFCQKELVATELLEKYRAWARAVNPGAPREALTLEACVECGRPCTGHQHFDIASAVPALMPARMMPDPLHPGRMIHDYATCAGGGRPELFARMLAVRDVYKNAGIKDPKAERVAAAKAADAAARDPAYLARGHAIFAQEADSRKFNVKVPQVKKYNDPAYDDVSEEAAAEAAAEAAEAALPVAAPAPAVAQLPVAYPPELPPAARAKIEEMLQIPAITRGNPILVMREYVLPTLTARGLSAEVAEDIIEDQATDTRSSPAFAAFAAAFRDIRAGGHVPDNYDQLWATVCFEYLAELEIKVAIFMNPAGGARGSGARGARGSSRSRKPRTYKRRHAHSGSGRKTYKKRKN
jgi:hypothetical protein